MHRVELKARARSRTMLSSRVPNAPCGVESNVVSVQKILYGPVPNAPCGVESQVMLIQINYFMWVPNAPCGVERRKGCNACHAMNAKVPNAPCGVERHGFSHEGCTSCEFLMHRVELKEAQTQTTQTQTTGSFLMHRVELKDAREEYMFCRETYSS